MAEMITLEKLASEKTFERKGVPPKSVEESEPFLKVLPGWTRANGSIAKEFQFKSYLDGLNFAFAVGKKAEEKDHHPDILVRWRRVKLTLSTHSIGGLSENDFIVAASSELLYKQLSSH